MKKLFLVIVASAFCSSIFAADANFKKNEISIGYGIATSMDFSQDFSNFNPISAVIYSAVGIDEVNDESTGSFNIDYTRRFNKHIGIGLTASYESIYEEWEERDTKAIVCKDNLSYWTLMPHIKLNWLNKKYVTLYSNLGLSLQYQSERQKSLNEENNSWGKKIDDKEFEIGFQVSPIGIEVGRTISGFAELGYGTAGLIQMGIRTKF